MFCVVVQTSFQVVWVFHLGLSIYFPRVVKYCCMSFVSQQFSEMTGLLLCHEIVCASFTHYDIRIAGRQAFLIHIDEIIHLKRSFSFLAHNWLFPSWIRSLTSKLSLLNVMRHWLVGVFLVTNKSIKPGWLTDWDVCPVVPPYYATPALNMEKSLALFAGCADVRFTGSLTVWHVWTIPA